MDLGSGSPTHHPLRLPLLELSPYPIRLGLLQGRALFPGKKGGGQKTTWSDADYFTLRQGKDVAKKEKEPRKKIKRRRHQLKKVAIGTEPGSLHEPVGDGGEGK